MADSALGFERNFDPNTYSPPAGGDRTPADRHARLNGAPDERDLATTPDLSSLLELAAAKQKAGENDAAEELFRKGLEIADRTLGATHPDLMLLLTDLTRLYLKRSAYASAEPLLLRLLEMKRGKGEDHPEVATVLANLANVRQALGRHESAEQLWRRVLEIRERTLAPNHFAIATALEHLAEACAARGKNSEALTVFQRALSIRERTLGTEHPSLRLSRERIADLQLQGSEDSLDSSSSADHVLPERYRLISAGTAAPRAEPPAASIAPVVHEKVSPPAPKKPAFVIHGRFVDTGAVAQQAAAVPHAAAVAKAASVAQADAVAQAAAPAPAPLADMTLPTDSTPVDVDAPDFDEPVYSETVVFRNALESLREEIEKPYAAPTVGARAAEFLASLTSSLGKKEAIVGVAAVVLAVLGVVALTSSHAFGESDRTANVPAAERTAVAPAAASPTPAGATTEASNASAANAPKAIVSHARVVEEKAAPTKKAPEKKVDVKPIAIPALSTAVISRLDSVAARAGNASSQVGDPILAQAAGAMTTQRSTFSGDGETLPSRARLIGDLPTPRVPNQVLDVEGEVRVQFSVDIEGRPVMSTFLVVHSPNPLLTTAVRKVIPEMRFEPARTGGPDPKVIADVVQIGFQFSRHE